MTPTDSSTPDSDLEAGVLRVVLDRPERRNAINHELLDALHAAVDRTVTDDAVRAVVITGRGDTFCAGADIYDYAAFDTEQFKAFTGRASSLCNRLTRARVPVIAAVNGLALGGGFELAMACDVVFAADDASFGLPETSIGLIPGWHGTQRLTNAIGAKLALESIWTGRRWSAHEARRLGLVNHVCEAGTVVARAVEFAARFSSASPAAVTAAKSAVRRAAVENVDNGLPVERAGLLDLFEHSGREGIAAFVEHRRPSWEGT